MSGYNVNITGESEVYHIYAKDRCLYNCLNKKEFKKLTQLADDNEKNFTRAENTKIAYEKDQSSLKFAAKEAIKVILKL